MSMAFMYIDDLYAMQRYSNCGKAEQLADRIRTVGFLLLGPSAWSISKADEESFFSRVQKHTGVVLHTSFGPEPRASFTKDRIERCMEFVDEVLNDPEATEWSLHFFQEAWGNFVWLQKVYRSFKPFASALRRPLQGQPSVTAKEARKVMVSPRLPTEGKATGCKKFRRDMRCARYMLERLLQLKTCYGECTKEATVPFLCMADIEDWGRLPTGTWTSIGGDASGTGWSVLDHFIREVLIMPIPQVLSDVLRKKAKLEPLDIRESFMVAIAEHLVLVFALLQWGPQWKAKGITLVKYYTDNQNSHAWTLSMFANNELAQDLCRLITVLSLKYDVQVRPFWLSTHINSFADLISRIYIDASHRCEKTYSEFVDKNNDLAEPYREVEPVERIQGLIDLIARTTDPFKVSEQLLNDVDEFLQQCLTVESLPAAHSTPTPKEAVRWTLPDRASATGESAEEFLSRADHAYWSPKHGRCPCVVLRYPEKSDNQQAEVQFWCGTKRVAASLIEPLATANYQFVFANQMTVGQSTTLPINVTAELPRTMREELEAYREGCTVQEAKAWCRGSDSAYSVGLIGAAAHVASMGVIRAKGKILFFCETDRLKQLLGEDLTGGTALGDLWELDWDRLPKATVWLITLPCINHARSGDHSGRHGEHGVLFVESVKAIMHCLPLVFFHEISDFAEYVNGGEDVELVIRGTSSKYVVHKVRMNMASHGDPSHRKRLGLVGFLRTFPGAHEWTPPAGDYGTDHSHCARDTADEDADVLEEDKRRGRLHTTYKEVSTPPFGEMQKLGRLKPGFAMGPGCEPNLFLGLDGTRNGPTTHGGGGTFPPQAWKQGEDLPWRKVTSIAEYYRTASLSTTVREWHESFLTDMAPAERKRTLRAWVNDGFFVHTVHDYMASIFALLEKHQVPHDMPRRSHSAMEYVTEGKWCPNGSGAAGGLGDHGRPSEAELRRYMVAHPLDWEVPLYPSQPGRRHHLKGRITDQEWAQMEYGLRFTEDVQLRDNSRAAYNLQCIKILEFVQRYPVAETFSEEHAETGILLNAVWKGEEVQRLLVDLIMHEAYVRGNSWGTCRQMLYALRHLQVRHSLTDPLKGKPRLWQLMDGLKKSKGPKRAKHPVCRAMLLYVEAMLNHEDDVEDLKLWASILLAFHFMLRSMDYCARREGGRFDRDTVLRIVDVVFCRAGRRLHSAFHTADELTLILGRGKTTEGGEVRTHVRSRNPKLCVVRVMGRLFDSIDRSKEEKPLFAWAEGSKRNGEGVRYCDVMQLLKTAAEACGHEAQHYGTHSLRRGGASAYVLAGGSVEEVAIFGRWRSSQAVRLYVEPAARGLMLGLEDKVNDGCRDEQLILRRPPRPREAELLRATLRAGARWI